MAKEARISVKVEPELKARLNAVSEGSMIGEASLVRACVVALADYWEDNQALTLPFLIVPRDQFAAAAKSPEAGNSDSAEEAK